MSRCKPNQRRQLQFLFLAALLILGLAGQAGAAAPPARNVILFIADGCGSEQYTLSRWAKGAPLAFDGVLTGMVRTRIADSVVADSAPAATAYASGQCTSDKIIGLGPDPKGLLPGVSDPGGLALRPLATVLEAARLMGKSTGLVATARVTHATPAAFAAHVPERSMEDAIAKQMANQGLTVLMGGGRRHFLPVVAGGAREDGLDLIGQLRGRGYQTPRTAAELASVKAGPVVGLFAKSHLKAELDRPQMAPDEPSLAQMTAKAIDVLSANPKGFFLMVEGSQIDWACHANDPAHLLGDLLAFDQAVGVGLDFARRRGGTLVVVTSDHNTGGMSIGNQATSKTYSQMKPDALLGPLARMRITAKSLWKKLGPDPGPDQVREAVALEWGMDITLAEAESILAVAGQYRQDPEYGLGEVLCPRYTLIGWSTHGHTGGDVPLFAFGPGRPTGLLDAPQVGLLLAKAMGADLRRLDQRLFAEAGQALAGWDLREDKEAEGWWLTARRQGREARFADGSNHLWLDGKDVALEGIALRVATTGRWYLPGDGARLLSAGPPAGKTGGGGTRRTWGQRGN
ncbi:MAG: alkaline phosphatase [Thermodesulfobacteriota bacterium]